MAMAKTKVKTKKSVPRKNPVKVVAKAKSKVQKKRQGKPHGYWPRKTEKQLIEPLSEDLREAWIKLRETAEGYGDQEIYTSAKAMMFARSRCYAFVRPKKKYLELTIFLHLPVESTLLKSARKVSAQKYALIVHVVHGDLLEEPVTDWLRQAFDETPAGRPEKVRADQSEDLAE